MGDFYATFSFFFIAGDQTLGLGHARKVLYFFLFLCMFRNIHTKERKQANQTTNSSMAEFIGPSADPSFM
jgi:hypothetical protein